MPFCTWWCRVHQEEWALKVKDHLRTRELWNFPVFQPSWTFQVADSRILTVSSFSEPCSNFLFTSALKHAWFMPGQVSLLHPALYIAIFLQSGKNIYTILYRHPIRILEWNLTIGGISSVGWFLHQYWLWHMWTLKCSSVMHMSLHFYIKKGGDSSPTLFQTDIRYWILLVDWEVWGLRCCGSWCWGGWGSQQDLPAGHPICMYIPLLSSLGWNDLIPSEGRRRKYWHRIE